MVNWEVVSALATLLSGLAVTATVIYLAIQTRNGNRQLAAQAVKDAITQFVGTYAGVTATEVDADNFRNGMNRLSELSKSQQAMFHAKMQLLANGYYQVWTLHNHGMLVDEDLFIKCRNLYITVLRTNGGLAWWQAWKHLPPEPYMKDLNWHIYDSNLVVPPATSDLAWFTPDHEEAERAT